MIKLGFLSRLGKCAERFFRRDKRTAKAPLPAPPAALPGPPSQAPAQPAPEAVRRPEVPTAEKIDLLLDALARQQKQVDAVLEQLPACVAAARRPAEQVPDGLREVIKRIGERDQEIASVLQEIVSEAVKQTDALRAIQASLAEEKPDDSGAADAMNRLAGVMEAYGKSQAAQVELMEQMRDRLGGANKELVELARGSERRFARLLYAAIALLGAILVAVIACSLLR